MPTPDSPLTRLMSIKSRKPADNIPLKIRRAETTATPAKNLSSPLTFSKFISSREALNEVTCFYHIPPPPTVKANMVKLMLEGFGGDRRRQKQKRRMLTSRQASAERPFFQVRGVTGEFKAAKFF